MDKDVTSPLFLLAFPSGSSPRLGTPRTGEERVSPSSLKTGPQLTSPAAGGVGWESSVYVSSENTQEGSRIS